MLALLPEQCPEQRHEIIGGMAGDNCSERNPSFIRIGHRLPANYADHPIDGFDLKASTERCLYDGRFGKRIAFAFNHGCAP